MAKRPARINKTLRAMDQVMDFGMRGESGVDGVLMGDSPKDVETGLGQWAEDSIRYRVLKNKMDMFGCRVSSLVANCPE
jgi:hypothetical protein